MQSGRQGGGGLNDGQTKIAPKAPVLDCGRPAKHAFITIEFNQINVDLQDIDQH